MPRSVEITTPMPSLEEVGESLGLSKRRQNELIALFRGGDGERVQHSGGTGRGRYRALKRAAKKAVR